MFMVGIQCSLQWRYIYLPWFNCQASLGWFMVRLRRFGPARWKQSVPHPRAASLHRLSFPRGGSRVLRLWSLEPRAAASRSAVCPAPWRRPADLAEVLPRTLIRTWSEHPAARTEPAVLWTERTSRTIWLKSAAIRASDSETVSTASVRYVFPRSLPG